MSLIIPLDILRFPANEYIPDKRIQRAKEFIDENYNKPITLEKIASIACLSKYHFCRLFKEKVGLSFRDYLYKVRLKRAVELLRNENLSITNIAEETGFRSRAHFYLGLTFIKSAPLT